MTTTFLDAIKQRRTFYSLSNKSPVEKKVIEDLIKDSLKYAPSAFNSQSARAVFLTGEQHQKLWDLTKAELKKIVPAEAFVQTEAKINGAFQAGYGTILIFEDESVVESLQKTYPMYAEAFPKFSLQSSGMFQIVVWTALEQLGFGASLQHYNPVIDEAVAKEWSIPKTWKLVAQMPFGMPAAVPGEKTFLSLDERFKVFG